MYYLAQKCIFEAKLWRKHSDYTVKMAVYSGHVQIRYAYVTDI